MLRKGSARQACLDPAVRPGQPLIRPLSYGMAPIQDLFCFQSCQRRREHAPKDQQVPAELAVEVAQSHLSAMQSP